MQFQIDVSRTYKNKAGYKAGGYKLNTSFQTETHTPESFLADVVQNGWPYTMVHAKRSPAETGADARGVVTPKHIENFTHRQELTVDDDSQRAGVVDFWLSDPFFSQYGYAFVESVNSKPGTAEKGHPTIIFDRPITDPALYKECMLAMWAAYPRLDKLSNIDRTIYNAEGARVHALGNICPFEVFEREILTPYRQELQREADEREAQRAALQAAQARAEKPLTGDALADYITRRIDRIFNDLARTIDERHSAIYNAGLKFGALESASWVNFWELGDGEAACLCACRQNGYTSKYSDNEILRNFNAGRAVGMTKPAPLPTFTERATVAKVEDKPEHHPDYIPGKTETLPNGHQVTHRPQTREAKAAALQARAAELEKRYQAGDKVAFLGDDPIDPDYIEYKRGQFSSAAKWRDYVLAHWPDLDAGEQYHIKLEENREARPQHCGEYRKFTLGNGQVITKRWTCGVCEQCQKRNVYTLRRALNEIQGFPVEGKLLDLDQEPEPNAGENAPPLAIVHGDFSLTRVDSEPDRLKFARDLRRAGTRYKCYPVDVDGEVFYDFIHNDDAGDPLPLMANDNRLLMWIMGAEGKRASGDLVPSLDKLKMRYRAALPYEVVLPELDDAGEPVDPDIFALDLPDIGTNAILPAVLVDFPVFDRDSLQAALYEINREQMRILNRRDDVNYHVYTKKKMYTRYSTLPLMIAEFNARQDEIRQKQRAE